MDEEFAKAGTVRSVNPARRELRIEGPQARVADLAGREWLHVEETTGEILRCKIAGVSVQRGFAIVTLAAGVSRDTVAGLKGHCIVSPVGELKEGGAFEFDAAELVGMSIVSVDGSIIGEVVAGFDTKANGVVEVLRPEGGSLLLPVVPEAIREVDWDGGKVIVGDIAPFAVESDSGPRLT